MGEDRGPTLLEKDCKQPLGASAVMTIYIVCEIEGKNEEVEHNFHKNKMTYITTQVH